jgi:hypothetical protein
LTLGALTIYRVSNTGVSFLSLGTGKFLKHVLPRSQCWCVDEDSTFVLTGKDGAYYRIELQSTTPEEKVLVEEFKRILGSLLRYEMTPCPFRDGYIELADKPPTPSRKSFGPLSPAKKWRLEKQWVPEDANLRAEFEARLQARRAALASNSNSQVLRRTSTNRDSPLRNAVVKGEIQPAATEEEPASAGASDFSAHPLKQHPVNRLSANTRSFTVPITSSYSSLSAVDDRNLTTTLSTSTPPQEMDSDVASIASSHDSFYSLDSDQEPPEMEHSVPHITQHLNITSISHTRSSSNTSSLGPETPRASTFSHTLPKIASTSSSLSSAFSSAPDESKFLQSESEIPRTPATVVRSTRPPRFYLDSTANSPVVSNEFIRRTCALLLAPPAHLVAIMWRVTEALMEGMPAGLSKHIPGAWESEVEGSEIEDEVDGDDEWEDARLVTDVDVIGVMSRRAVEEGWGVE